MAVTVTSDLTIIDSADTATGWNGTSGGQDLEVYVQGGATPASYTSQTGKNDGTSLTTFTPATNIDITTYTDTHIYFWMRNDVFPFTEDKTTGTTTPSGLNFRLTDSAGNYIDWHVAGADTWRGEWKGFVVDTANTTQVYATSGTLDKTDIDVISWYVDNQNSGNIRIIDNTWHDVIRFGEGLTATGTTFNFADIGNDDSGLANMYSVVQNTSGVSFVQGKLIIGNGATTTTFASVGEVLIFTDPQSSGLGGGAVGTVAPGLYELIATGSGCDFSCKGSVVSAAGVETFNLDLDEANINSITFTGNTVSNASNAYFLNDGTNAVITGNVFDSCGAIYPQGSKFEDNTITNTTETTSGSLYLDSSTAASNAKSLVFNNYAANTRYAVYIPAAVTGTINMTDYIFDTPTSVYCIYWAATGGTLTINKLGTTNVGTSAWSSGGGTVTISASYTLTLTDIVEGVQVTIVNSSTRAELQNSSAPANGIVTYSHQGGTTVDILLMDLDYDPNLSDIYDLTLPAADSTIKFQMINDPNFNNPA